MPKDMPQSALKWYKMWISQWPESWHTLDVQRFYMFISILLKKIRKERSRYWLEENLRMDCPKLSESDIQQYGEIYEHIKDYRKVWRSDQAKLIALDEFERQKEEYRKRYL